MSNQSDMLASPARATTLPPELLSRVFEHHIAACKATWDDGAPYDRTAPASCSADAVGPYTWLHVTHVCAYWRAVALANPLLWANIVLVRSTPCVEAALARSQQAPLTVQSYEPRCSGAGAFPTRSLRLTLQHMHRVRALDLRVKWWVFFDYVAPALEQPAPLLERVHLATPSGLLDEFPISPAFDLAPSEDSSSLRELTLGAYGFPWSRAAQFRGLHSLTVHRGAGRCPTPSGVLAALAHMPQLASLTLSDVFHPSTKNTYTLPRLAGTVALPALQTLTLAGDAVACTTLLCALRTPPHTRTTLDFKSRTATHALAFCMSAACAHLALVAPTVRLCDAAKYCTALFFPAAQAASEQRGVVLRVSFDHSFLPSLPLALPEASTLCMHKLKLDLLGPPPGVRACEETECAVADL